MQTKSKSTANVYVKMDILKSICNAHSVISNVPHALKNLIIVLVVINKNIEKNRKIHVFVMMVILKMKIKSVCLVIQTKVKLIRIVNIKTALIMFGHKEKIVMMEITSIEMVVQIVKLIQIILALILYFNHHFALNVVIIVKNVK